MTEEYVRKEEFNSLKDEVQEIKKEMAESSKLLQEIERKIDIISEKINTSNEISELKIMPLDNRVTKLENGINWLWKLCAATIITGVITAVINFR